MNIARIILFTGKTGHIRPFIVTGLIYLVGFLLVCTILQMVILILGAHGFSLSLFILDLAAKAKVLALKGWHAL